MENVMHWLSNSYHADLVDAVDRAEQGLLPPAEQEYCFEEIEATKGTAEYPQDGDVLFSKLRRALAAHEQITDRQQAEKEFAAQGAKLLFYASLDRYTFAEIVYVPQQNAYDARLYINFDKHSDAMPDCVQALRRALDEWLKESGVSYVPGAVNIAPADCADSRFNTVQEAIALIDNGLRDPEQLKQ